MMILSTTTKYNGTLSRHSQLNIHTQSVVVRSHHAFSSNKGKTKKRKISRHPPSSNDKYDRNTHSSTGWHMYDVRVTVQIVETVHSGNEHSKLTC